MSHLKNQMYKIKPQGLCPYGTDLKNRSPCLGTRPDRGINAGALFLPALKSYSNLVHAINIFYSLPGNATIF